MTDQTDVVEPAAVEVTTRAELLAERAAAVRRLNQRYDSMGAIVVGVVAALLAVAGLYGAGFWLNEGLVEGGDAAANLVLAGLALIVVAAWPARVLVRRARTGGDVAAARERWLDADATAASRALPTGEMTPELRTGWDARTDEDFDDVATRDVGEAQAVLTGNGLLTRAVLAGLGLGLAAALGLSAGTSFESPLFAVGGAAAFLVLLISSGRFAVGSTRIAYRAQQRINRRIAERTVLTGERRVTGVASAAERTQTVPIAARVAAGIVVLAIAVFLLVRIASAGPAAIAIVVGIVVLAIVLILMSMWRVRSAERGATRAVMGAAVGGGLRLSSLGLTVEQPQLGAVAIGREQIQLSGPVNTSIPVAQVRGATVTAKRPAAFGRCVVAVYTADGQTLLLTTTAGRRAQRLLRDAGIEFVGDRQS